MVGCNMYIGKKKQISRINFLFVIAIFIDQIRCRRFNKVLERAIQENKRRVLYRMHVFAKLEFENRRFKYKRAIMPMVITFRALRHNALVNRYYFLFIDK